MLTEFNALQLKDVEIQGYLDEYLEQNGVTVTQNPEGNISRELDPWEVILREHK